MTLWYTSLTLLFHTFERSYSIRLPESILATSVEAGQRPYALAMGRLWLLSPWWAWLSGPKGGILSSPQNFNLVCLGCFAVGAEEPKPRLNMRDKRPANRLSLARGEMKQWPTDTVPFFPWIRDLVHHRVKRPANNGVIQSNENHPVWMFFLGCWTAGVDSTGALSFFLFVHLTVCAFCFVVLGSGLKPSICNVWSC